MQYGGSQHWGEAREKKSRRVASRFSLFSCFLECFQGQTPFDVADESVAALLEELSQKQASVSLSDVVRLWTLEAWFPLMRLFFLFHSGLMRGQYWTGNPGPTL